MKKYFQGLFFRTLVTKIKKNKKKSFQEKKIMIVLFGQIGIISYSKPLININIKTLSRKERCGAYN